MNRGVPVLFAWIVAPLVALAANAQPARTFVSSAGLDTNPCSRTAPCRNFAAAVAAVAPYGEVIVLDSAGYGPVTVDRSVSLIAPAGVYAGITATTGNAITVSAGPSTTVILRGLTLNGFGAVAGIEAASVGTLSVEHCTIRLFGYGLHQSCGGNLTVSDTVARENGNHAFAMYPATTLVALFYRCRAELNSGNGFAVAGSSPGSRITVRDSVAFGNFTSAGFLATVAEMNLKNCTAASNGYGVYASVNGTVSVSGTIVSDNVNYGLALNGGGAVLYTYGNNEVIGNGNATFGPVTPVTTQ